MRRPRKLDAARAALAAARVSLDAATQAHATATHESEEGRVYLDAARVTYGDDPTEANRNALDVTKQGAELAKLRADGAARKLDAARAAYGAAETTEARESYAANMPRASRPALFDSLAPDIARIAAIDAAPRVDAPRGVTPCRLCNPYPSSGRPVGLLDVFAAPAPLDVCSLSARALSAAMAQQAARDVERARAVRSIHVALVAQHSAVDAVRAACATLGTETPRDVAPVPMGHVLAAVALEAYALARPAFAAEWFTEWFGYAVSDLVVVPPAPRLPHTLAAYLRWARGAVRTGNIVTALAAVERPVFSAREIRAEDAREAAETKQREASAKRTAEEERKRLARSDPAAAEDESEGAFHHDPATGIVSMGIH